MIGSPREPPPVPAGGPPPVSDATPPSAQQVPEPNAAAARPSGPPETIHRQRLQQTLRARGQPRAARPRDPLWQDGLRQCERLIRVEVAAQARQWQQQGVAACEIANLLACPSRTLRFWQQQLAAERLAARPLGRPHRYASGVQRQEVLGFLHQHGPWVGLPSLRGRYGDLPAAELRDLLRCFRHLWVGAHPRQGWVLDWHQPGTVWALDFTKVSRPIDGCFPYLLAVRDLASGYQLAWRAVAAADAATVLLELELLFTIYGPPLVLKSDNGSAFRAGATQRFLERWQVWPLYSPPGQPGYNGAIEASIGSLKKRTEQLAYQAGHAGSWTLAEVERARELANELARPRGWRGPAPQTRWAGRLPPTRAEHEDFSAVVRRTEEELRVPQHIAADAVLDHYEQAALHRRVLAQVLVQRGLLTITRRRLPQTFYGHKVADIR
jgi:transposase InsO family protein